MDDKKTVIIKRQKLTIGLVEKTIRDKRGNVTQVAKELGWSRTHVNRYIDKHPKLKEVAQGERETMVDNVESEFYRVCLDPNADGHVTAMIFFLKTQGKGRGYVERWEHTGKDNEPIVFEIVKREA